MTSFASRAVIGVLIAGAVFVPVTASANPAASGLERELTAMVERVAPAITSLRTIRTMPGSAERGRCQGSGVILAGGLIATTLSVAGPGDVVEVRYWNNEQCRAEVVAVDPLREICLLRPKELRGVPLELGRADSLLAGSWVFVMGHALASPEASLTSGRFSSRTVINLNDSSLDRIELLQLEANVFPGNSGAAVIDSRGRLVGIILGGLGPDGFLDPVVLSSLDDEEVRAPGQCLMSQPALGIGFAIPAGDVASLVASARNGLADKPGYLGIRVDVSRSGDAQIGVSVQDVVAGSPAALAGVRPGDQILRMNNTPVPDGVTLASLVRNLGPGAETRLEYMPRDGSGPQERRIKLGDYTSDYRMHLIWHRLLWRRASSLAEARDTLRRQLQLVDDELRQVRELDRRASASAVN